MDGATNPAAGRGFSGLTRWLAERKGFATLAAVALGYGFLLGLRTVSDFDLFWQLASGRWVVQHHAVFSIEIFSYSAQGQPWIYPAASGVFFYLAYLLGGYGLLSWIGVAACCGTILILLRRGAEVSAALAIVLVPVIAARTAPRADLFTVVIFAAFLSVLWQQFQSGKSRLWLLPFLMLCWVNLHLGFVAGLALCCAYAGYEAVRIFRPENAAAAKKEIVQLGAWLGAVLVATLINPWGWNLYGALFRQDAVMSAHAAHIYEWSSMTLNSNSLKLAFDLRDADSAYIWLLVLAACAALVALWRREWVAAVVLVGSLWVGFRHIRFLAMLACVVIVVGGSVLQGGLRDLQQKFKGNHVLPGLKLILAAALVLLALVRSSDLVSNHAYFSRDQLSSFGAGLSWWFPDRAMDFVAREKLPGQVFNSYEEGGFLLWKLGPQYGDFVDSRAVPFGSDIFERMNQLLQAPPDSPDWEQTADFYGIKTVVFPLARYSGLKYVGGVLPLYCNSENWQPVYLDEVSIVIVRRSPETEDLIRRFHVDCATAPLPAPAVHQDRATEFNRWSNAASLLLALGRNQESAEASTRALSIFSDSPALWYFRARARLQTGDAAGAEKDLLQSARLEVREATWEELAQLYLNQRRYPEAIDALEKLSVLSPNPAQTLMTLGYAELQAGRAADALKAFDRAVAALPKDAGVLPVAEADHGRATAWLLSKNLQKARFFEEQAVKIAPQNPNYWAQLAGIYEGLGLDEDARRASEQAAALGGSQ